ncbi:MAG TPA: MltA domain-containing protein, partial [Candidatus Binatia bacterium]|nr:MltA domain-containing protein [Candidatus Binatia bacterium]
LAESLSAAGELLDQRPSRARLASELAARFDLVASSGDAQEAEVLFTGYYQPVIEASLTPGEGFDYPIYAVPTDLVAQVQAGPELGNGGEKKLGRIENSVLVPYYSRREIDQLGALRGRNLEIAWVKDPIDLFFLHIQGSGLLRLRDGREVTVGYAAQNALPYRSIGRLLIDNGKVPKEEMSMQRLRRYLTENPAEQDEVFAYNESYVFFRLIDGGPQGSLGVPVTAGRSIATDARLFPRAALALMQTDIPIIGALGELAGWRPVTRFVVNQDTGGAIRGLQRADYYFGTGEEAGARAGYMNRPGRLYFLVLKNDP